MATTPHADSPKQSSSASKAPDPKEPDPKAKSTTSPKPGPQHAILAPDQALSLFRNGHRIAADGDPQDKWISMGRAVDGVEVYQQPLTPDLVAMITGGSYYMVDAQAYLDNPPAAPAAGAPTIIDVPHVSATGASASCTVGNWNGEPTSYTYAWQRNGTPITGATSANYTMVAADTGAAIGCIVTATNDSGSTAAPLSNTVVGP